MYLLYLWLYLVIPTCFLPTLICLLNFYLMYFITNYLKSSWEINRSKFLKKIYNYPTRSQNNNKDSNFIITGNSHCGPTRIRPYSKNFTSTFSFILHNKYLRLLRLLFLCHKWGKQSMESWCHMRVSSVARTWTCTVCLRRGWSLWFMQVLRLSRSPDRAEALCLLAWPTRLPLLFDGKTLLTLCPT